MRVPRAIAAALLATGCGGGAAAPAGPPAAAAVAAPDAPDVPDVPLADMIGPYADVAAYCAELEAAAPPLVKMYDELPTDGREVCRAGVPVEGVTEVAGQGVVRMARLFVVGEGLGRCQLAIVTSAGTYVAAERFDCAAEHPGRRIETTIDELAIDGDRVIARWHATRVEGGYGYGFGPEDEWTEETVAVTGRLVCRASAGAPPACEPMDIDGEVQEP